MRRPNTLTKRQKEVLSFIERYTRRHGFPPAIREMGRALGISSTNGVSDHLKRLEIKGYIHRGVPGRSRGCVLTDLGYATLRRPRDAYPLRELPEGCTEIPVVVRSPNRRQLEDYVTLRGGRLRESQSYVVCTLPIEGVAKKVKISKAGLSWDAQIGTILAEIGLIENRSAMSVYEDMTDDFIGRTLGASQRIG